MRMLCMLCEGCAGKQQPVTASDQVSKTQATPHKLSGQIMLCEKGPGTVIGSGLLSSREHGSCPLEFKCHTTPAGPVHAATW